MNSRMTRIDDELEVIDFVKKAAEVFAEHPEYTTYGDMTPGSLLAMRWGLGNDDVLVVRLRVGREARRVLAAGQLPELHQGAEVNTVYIVAGVRYDNWHILPDAYTSRADAEKAALRHTQRDPFGLGLEYHVKEMRVIGQEHS